MRELLVPTFVALLMAGCGEEPQNPEDSNDTENNTSALAPPVVQLVKAPFVEKWDEYSRAPNASPKRCVDLLEYTRGK